MGRRDNQQQTTQQLGRRDRTIQAPTPVETTTQVRGDGNSFTNLPSNLKMLAQGNIKLGDVAKNIPKVAKRGAIKTAETVVPALTNFTKTTGGIIGEGIAYATDPYEFLGGNNNIREQYKAGNLDILPNVTKTSQKDLLKDTVAAGLEATILRSVPAAMKGKLATRVGIGGLEGIGFAISEGMAKDQTADEILKNATQYGVAGSALNAALPWLGPLLQKELGRAPASLKKALKDEVQAASKTTPDIQPTPGRREPSVEAQPTSAGVQQVQGEQLPIGGQTKGVSRLEARLIAQSEDPAYKAGVDNYTKYSNKADAPEITGSSNAEQIKRSTQAVESLTPAQINDIASGVTELPPGVLRTSFLKAASEKAALEGNSALVNRLGRAVGQLARRFGQEIQFTKNFDQLDPVTNIADILAVRLKAAERTLPKGKTTSTYIKDNVKAGREASTSGQVKITEAQSLVDSIIC